MYDRLLACRCEAINNQPDYVEAQYNLGMFLLAAGQRDDALKQYQILKTLDADKADKFYLSSRPQCSNHNASGFRRVAFGWRCSGARRARA